jgi:hypothetical protein
MTTTIVATDMGTGSSRRDEARYLARALCVVDKAATDRGRARLTELRITHRRSGPRDPENDAFVEARFSKLKPPSQPQRAEATTPTGSTPKPSAAHRAEVGPVEIVAVRIGQTVPPSQNRGAAYSASSARHCRSQGHVTN